MKKNLSKVLQRHGHFVARRRSRVIAQGPTLRVLWRKLMAKGMAYANDVVIGYVPPRGAICVYNLSIPV